MTEPATHKLGEVLRAAREAKGVDLPRVERETKIRTRYLQALEQGNYRELPGAVYTKGFLRNYGAYLGLDPEYLIDLYRLETASGVVERPSVQPPPRPIATRRARALVITPGAVVAALLTVGVALFVVYIVSELVTFAGQPELRITDPAGDVRGYEGDSYTLRGVTEPNARVRVETAARAIEVTADENGEFEVEVSLVPGSNLIRLRATDPLTGRDSPEVSRTILVGEEGPSPTAGPMLALTAPEDGASVAAPVEIAGTAAPAAEVTVTASLVQAAPLGFRITSLGGQQVPVPDATPAPPEPLTLTAGEDGAFSATLPLRPGTWQLSVDDGVVEEPLTRTVIVAAPTGLSGSLVVAGSPSYLEIDEDGTPKQGISGRNAPPGTTVELRARQTLRIRVGNAAAVTLTINGVQLGAMGGPGAVVEWLITPG
ncbi:MAG TPA: RodZ domain-containing protein [candidate division Zixibacteria bacterium]|nr:RodZ domain-containing protein [candidate division Zixibacteria bacterium]